MTVWKRLRKTRGRNSGISTTTNYAEVLASKEIRNIVISLPAEHHYRYAKKALEAGKHVYVEKPLALKLSEAEELVALGKRKQMVLMVGHLMQYHTAFIKLKELVHADALGPVYYIYSNRLSLGKIRREENALWSFAPHDISMILALCGQEPISVSATYGNYLQENIADVTVTHLQFANGVRSHVFVSWLHPFKEQKLVVVGKEKMAVFSDTEEWDSKLVLYSHSITWDNGLPIPLKAAPELVEVYPSEPLRNECLHFLECAAQNRQPITDGEEGVRVLRVLHAAQQYLK